jgi:two-component system, NarL family, invasion response regulator UvrY
MIRVLLIDDHILVRRAIRTLLTSAKDIQIVGETSTGMEGVQLARELHPSVIILDLKLPDISGLEVTTRCLRLEPAPKILVLSSTSHHEYSQRVLKMGAAGFLTKDTDREELIKAIRTVHRNQPFISAVIASRLALAKIDYKAQAIFNELNNKEMEVLLLSIRSLPAVEIAKRLRIDSKTVHGHRCRIFKKLGIENEVGLLLLALREGLVTVDETDP